MAEQERKTKAERRAEARAERKRKEEEAARRRRKESIRNTLIAVAVVAVIAIVAIPAVMSLVGGDEESSITISQAAALEARQAAGCEMVVDGQPLPDASHVDPAEAPPADVLYAASTVRPTHSGPHFSSTTPNVGGVPNAPLDERGLTHNLEHGSIVVWFDADQVDRGDVNEMERWMQARKDQGFTSNAGGGVFVSPYEGFTDDRPIAIRGWGQALNCQEWDQTVADSMLIDYYGTNGLAPERSLAPYPTGVLGYGEEGATGDATDGATEDATDGGTEN